MKLLNKNNIIKNQVNTIEQYKVLNYLKDTFNTDAIAIYLVDLINLGSIIFRI